MTHHDVDFFLWTQEQAAALRAMPRLNSLDSDNLAEEIEDMGRAELNKVASLLVQVLTHLIKMSAYPTSEARVHWHEEILAFQSDARRAYTPGMRQRLDLADLWHDARRRAMAAGVVGVPEECPVELEALLEREFDVEGVVRGIAFPRSHRA